MGLGDDTVTLTGTADVLGDVSTCNGDATVTLANAQAMLVAAF
jgi:hypothetical protein